MRLWGDGSLRSRDNNLFKLLAITQGLRTNDDCEIKAARPELLGGLELLDAESDALCGAQKYERSPDKVDIGAGSYTRKLHTQAGEVELTVAIQHLRTQ